MIDPDHDCERCHYNPSVMHALAILLDCHDNFAEAVSIAAIQWRYGGGDAKHARQVYSVLNGEVPCA